MYNTVIDNPTEHSAAAAEREVGSHEEFGSFLLPVNIFPAVIFFPLKSLILPRGNPILTSRVSRIRAEKDCWRKNYLFLMVFVRCLQQGGGVDSEEGFQSGTTGQKMNNPCNHM